MNSIPKKKILDHLFLFIFISLSCFSFAQTTQIVIIETEADAVVGLDRKAFIGLGNTSDHSQGYAHDFTLPEAENECQSITGISVQVTVSSFTNTGGCPHPTLYYNLYYGCASYNGGATCLPASNLLAEPNFAPGSNSPLFNYGNPFGSPLNGDLVPEFGGNFSVDVVPVSTPGCNAISNGLSYQYTMTVIITVEGEASVGSIEEQIPNDLSLSCDEDVPSFTEIDLSDVCGVEAIETEEVSVEGSCEGEFTLTRTWNAIDFEGQTVASFQQTIEVTDTTAPEFVGELPQDMVLSCSNEMPEIPNIEAIDNCSDIVISVEQIIIEDADCAQNFTLQTIYTATDACGNFSTYEQNIQFLDTEGPVFDAGITTEITLECGLPIPMNEPMVTDSCSNEVMLSFTDEVSDNCEGGKETIRTWEATDNCGNSSFLSISYVEFCEPIVYQGISPNNDGINDHLEIERINCFPDNNFQVFNRYGRKVFSATNYDNSTNLFEGNDEAGNFLVTGTYFYVLNYKTSNNSDYTSVKGWIYINRESN